MVIGYTLLVIGYMLLVNRLHQFLQIYNPDNSTLKSENLSYFNLTYR